MAARRLKVFRTAIGFHDAYVAAPSKKAALEAWGSDHDLFASGRAELVTDERLIAKPLAEPGKVIKLTRGSAEEHLSALSRMPKATRRTSAEAVVEPKRPSRPPPPRPSRAQLEKAEAALEQAERDRDTALREITDEQRQLDRRRKAVERDHRREIDRLKRLEERQRDRYDASLDAWRNSE